MGQQFQLCTKTHTQTHTVVWILDKNSAKILYTALCTSANTQTFRLCDEIYFIAWCDNLFVVKQYVSVWMGSRSRPASNDRILCVQYAIHIMAYHWILLSQSFWNYGILPLAVCNVHARTSKTIQQVFANNNIIRYANRYSHIFIYTHQTVQTIHVLTAKLNNFPFHHFYSSKICSRGTRLTLCLANERDGHDHRETETHRERDRMNLKLPVFWSFWFSSYIFHIFERAVDRVRFKCAVLCAMRCHAMPLFC